MDERPQNGSENKKNGQKNEEDEQQNKNESNSADLEMEESKNDIDDILGMKEQDLDKKVVHEHQNGEQLRVRKRKNVFDKEPEVALSEPERKKIKSSENHGDQNVENAVNLVVQENGLNATENHGAGNDHNGSKNDKETVQDEEVMELDETKIYEDRLDAFMMEISNHNLPKFKEDFFLSPEELNELSQREKHDLTVELNSIFSGQFNFPVNPQTWAQCKIPIRLILALIREGYQQPTSFQSKAIPSIMSGRDIIGIAKTGSGKTLAYLLPMFINILDQPELEEGHGPIAVIVAPTRELAMQTHKEANKFAKVLGLRAVCFFGGKEGISEQHEEQKIGMKEQIADLNRGAHFVVCTPGTFDLFGVWNTEHKGKGSNLKNVKYLVLDQPDYNFHLGFENQICQIVKNLPFEMQMIIISAQFHSYLDDIVEKLIDQPVEMIVGRKSLVRPDGKQIMMYYKNDDDKFRKLLVLLEKNYQLGYNLIFVDNNNMAEDITNKLRDTQFNSVATLHSGIRQHQMDSSSAHFKRGVVKVIVTTPEAARILALSSVNMLVNFDYPNHLNFENYINRVVKPAGAGLVSYGYIFLKSEDVEKTMDDIREAFQDAGCNPPEANAEIETQKMPNGVQNTENSAEAKETLVCSIETTNESDDLKISRNSESGKGVKKENNGLLKRIWINAKKIFNVSKNEKQVEKLVAPFTVQKLPRADQGTSAQMTRGMLAKVNEDSASNNSGSIAKTTEFGGEVYPQDDNDNAQ